MNNKQLFSRIAAALCALCFIQLTQSSALAQATVTTDREDYAPSRRKKRRLSRAEPVVGGFNNTNVLLHAAIAMIGCKVVGGFNNASVLSHVRLKVVHRVCAEVVT
jgi:hypothetical protein